MASLTGVANLRGYIMSRDLNDLESGFKASVVELIGLTGDAGYTMRPYFTLRTPFEQAKLWRQSRPIEEINIEVSRFENAGADFLAFCLDSVGPQNGDPVTNALPGYSWHQWGEAVDCFWLVNGKAVWSSRKKINGKNGYRVYANTAVSMGLTSGGFWSSLKDWPHVQLRKTSSPKSVFSIHQINEQMSNQFG